MASGLTVYLGANTAGLKAGLASARAAVAKTASAMASIGKAGVLGGAAAGAAGLALGIKLNSIGEAARSSAARVRSVANSMGLFGSQANAVAARISDLADKTELATGVDGDSIETAAAKLLTFKELAKTAGTVGGAFDRATQATIDLAAAGFGSAEGNAVMLGKALQDPVKGITAMTRAGVTFTAQEKAKIKALAETGQVLKAQDMILRSVETQVGGAAAATATGSARIKAALSQGFESLAIPLASAVEQFAPKFIAWIESIKPKLIEAGQFLVAIFESGNATALIWESFRLGITEAVNFLWATMQGALLASGQLLLERFKVAISALSMVTRPEFWAGLWASLQAGFFSVVSYLQKAIVGLLEMIKPVAEALGQGDTIADAQATVGESAQALDEMAAEKGAEARQALAPLGAELGEKIAASAAAVGERFREGFDSASQIDTAGMKENLQKIVGDIRASMPKADEVKPVAPVVNPQEEDDEVPGTAKEKERRDISPLVGSLAKIGGGGYAPNGMLDFQRENNRLTAKTNELLQRVLEKKGGPMTATFA
jgi:hypothetical protein